jgi:hypothetical protein
VKFLGPPSSGSIAAVTYSHNRGGQYTRTRNGRGGTGSADTAAGVIAWQGLTDEERATWRAAAASQRRQGPLGPHTLSAYQAFMSAYLSQASAGVVPSLTPAPESLFRLRTTSLFCTLFAALAQVHLQAFSNLHVGAGTPGSANKVLMDISGSTVSTGVTFAPGRHGWKRLQVFALTDFMDVSALTTYLTGDTFFIRIREWRDDFVIGPATIQRVTCP